MPETVNASNDSELLKAWGMDNYRYPDESAVWSIVNGTKPKIEQGAETKYSGVSIGSMAAAIYDSIFGGFIKGYRSLKPAENTEFNEFKKSVMDYKIPDYTTVKPKEATVPGPGVTPVPRPVPKTDEKKADDIIEKMKKYQPAKVYESPDGRGDIYLVLDNVGSPSINFNPSINPIITGGNNINGYYPIPGMKKACAA